MVPWSRPDPRSIPPSSFFHLRGDRLQGRPSSYRTTLTSGLRPLRRTPSTPLSYTLPPFTVQCRPTPLTHLTDPPPPPASLSVRTLVVLVSLPKSPSPTQPPLAGSRKRGRGRQGRGHKYSVGRTARGRSPWVPKRDPRPGRSRHTHRDGPTVSAPSTCPDAPQKHLTLHRRRRGRRKDRTGDTHIVCPSRSGRRSGGTHGHRGRHPHALRSTLSTRLGVLLLGWEGVGRT